MMIEATLSVSEQDRISEEGAAHCRSHRTNKEWWLNNPTLPAQINTNCGKPVLRPKPNALVLRGATGNAD